MTHPLSSVDISIFLLEISKFCYIKKYRYWYMIGLDFDTWFLILLNFLESLIIVLINMVTILMMSAKMASLGLLKMRGFWNKGYDVIIFAHGVTNKFLLHDSNYIIDVVMWAKFDNCIIPMRKVIITSIWYRFDQKNRFFEEWSWFKFNNFGLALGTNFIFYTSVAKRVKSKIQKVLGASSNVCRSYKGKTGSPPILG